MRQHVFFKTISLLLALALSAGLLAVPAAASGCEHLVTGTRSEQLSCTEMGATVTTCLDCGEELRRVYDQPPLGHLCTSSVTREATVDQTGVRTYTCIRCGDSYTEPIPKLDAPTGGTGGESSSLPDADLPDGQQPEDDPPAGQGGDAPGSSQGQDPSGGPDAPSGSEGGGQDTCRHVWEPVSRATPATCTEPARYYHTCRLCGLEEVDFTSPALGHTYTSEITRYATVDQTGVRTYTCIRCGDSYTEPIPKLDQSDVAGKTGNRNSGSLDMEKLSQQEIESLLAESPLTLPEEVFDAAPSTAAPYTTGKVKTSALQAAADRLNALRRIAGLPAVTLDLSLCENAQYGAVIQAANGSLDHYPDQPAGMGDSFYQQAKSASASSNLAAGHTLTGAVDAFMDDSDASNIATLGHRRWQLNPTLGKVGFGYAVSSRGYSRYVAEKVFDRSGAGCDYDFIGWPASGSFPAQLFDGGTAWSVTLNPTAYQTAVKSALTVTLTRKADGRTWTFSSRGSDGFFNVTSSGYGEGYCVIFRPEGVETYEGTYTVRIEGLKALNGQDVEDFTYQADFFGSETAGQDSTAAEPPEQAGTGPQGGSSQTTGAAFRDVPAAHWASAAIKAAVEQGFVNGYADGTFRPADPVTNAHFNAMLSRAFYPADLKAAKTGAGWWTPNVTVNDAHGILDGTDLKQAELAEGVWSAEINAPISRCDMAQMMYNILLDKGAPLPSAAECQAAQSRMGDWSRIPARYQEAVSTCYALGLLNGQKDGTFGGSSSMNRAQGCTVISRLLDYIA